MKNVKWAFMGRIILSLAFIVMLVYGFVALVKTKFRFYDTVVLKLNVWTNPAQTLWNILIIIAFFTFIFWAIWTIKRRISFWIWGVLYSTIGLLTFVFTLLENLNDSTRIAIGLVISLLLMIGSGFLIFVAYRMNNKETITNNWQFWKKTIDTNDTNNSDSNLPTIVD